MNKFLIFFLAVVATSSAYVIEDEMGQRQRRQATTSVDISKGKGGGVEATVAHKGKIFDTGVHRLDGGVTASKQIKPSGPLSAGGRLEYTHIPSGSSVNVGAQHNPHFGTSLNANANLKIWKKGDSSLDAVGRYERHYGGPLGTSNPNYYVGVQFRHKF